MRYRKLPLRLLSALAIFIMAPPLATLSNVTAQTASNGELIHDPANIRWEPAGPSKRAKVVESEGVPGGQAISIQVKKKPNKVWDVNMRAPFDTIIEKGDTIQVSFWARTAKSQKGYETGKISVALGRKIEPYDTVINQEIQPAIDWQVYTFTGTAEADFPPSESDMGFNLGFQKQTIEFGPFYAAKIDPEPAVSPPPSQQSSEINSVTPTTDNTLQRFTKAFGPGVSSEFASVDARVETALHIEASQTVANSWDAMATGDLLPQEIRAGELVSLTFWARAINRNGTVSALIQQAEAPYEAAVSTTLEITPDWRQYRVEGLSNIDLESLEGSVVLHLGHAVQTIELGPFEVSVG